jgi:uncharacterized protein
VSRFYRPAPFRRYPVRKQGSGIGRGLASARAGQQTSEHGAQLSPLDEVEREIAVESYIEKRTNVRSRKLNERSRMTTTDRAVTLTELRSKRDIIIRLAAARGARKVRVFGSVARNDARPTSDVDFLVELDPGRDVADLSELILDLQDELDRHVHVVALDNRTKLDEQVEREAVPL